MNKAVIRRAAATARLLGYRVTREFLSTGGDRLNVISPSGGYIYHFSTTGYLGYDERKCLELTTEDILGHFLTRLHMEKHYGIHTEHYWEQ